MRWSRFIIVVMLFVGMFSGPDVTTYLRAQGNIDPDKAAYLRSQKNRRVIPKETRHSQANPVPNVLAIGERAPSFLGGQFYMASMNGELTDNYTEKGWRGAGRSMSPGMGMPSFTVPAGGFDSPLWASACGITAFLPNAAGIGGAFAEGSFVGTNNVYRNPPHNRIESPTGFWSDLGGTGSPGLALGTAGPGGHREPFIIENTYYNNVGIEIKRQAYSFSYGYNHTNDFILMRHVLNATGDVDVDRDGNMEENGATVQNFGMIFNYDFAMPTSLDPSSTAIIELRGGDDKASNSFMAEFMGRSVPPNLPNSGRFNQAPYHDRFYTGISMMFDEDDPRNSGVDDYIWSLIRLNFNPLHLGEASLLVIKGDGTASSPYANGIPGDMDDPAAFTIWGTPAIGLFQQSSWWQFDWRGVFNWYAMNMSQWLTSYPGDAGQPLDFAANPDVFVSGGVLDQNTDLGTWVARPELGGAGGSMPGPLSLLWGDPRNLTQTGNVAVNELGKTSGQYDNVTLFDLPRDAGNTSKWVDGSGVTLAPDPFEGADRKDLTSTTGCTRNSLGWGPFTLSPGESMTVWQVDLVGAGTDGAYDVYLRAQDVWMQRKYNPANDTYYWDGSNDRIIPTYDTAGHITGTQTVNLGRTPDSGAVFFPPPPPTLSVISTLNGTVLLAWANNAEEAIDPGLGTTDFSEYRVYRASGFIDQFPTATVSHPIGYNSTIIPANMGLSGGSTPVTDVTDPKIAAVKQSHPYARFIQEGSVLGADYNIGAVFDFITADVNRFAAPGFAGPYVQMASFPPGGGTNTFNPPAQVTVPNPIAPENRFPGFESDLIETPPSSRQIVDANGALGATAAIEVTFPMERYPNSTPFEPVAGLPVDPRLAGKSGYIFEDKSVLIGFNYWYYVAAVDNESAVQRDFDSVLQDPTGSSKTQILRQIEGLESFYTMNANGTDGRWHGTFPYRGRLVGPEVPGQEVIPTTIARNTLSGPDWRDIITVAPNPFVFQAQWDLAVPGQQSIKFFNLPVPSRISIFDAAGLPVKAFNVPDAEETVTVGGVTSWDLKNSSNVPVSSGLYIAVIEAEIGGVNSSKTLKIYIRR